MSISLKAARIRPDRIWPSRTTVRESKLGPFVCSPADHILMVANSEKSPALKQEILEAAFEADPYCPSLFLALADLALSEEERAKHLNKAVRLGYAAWKEFGQERTIRWWDDIGTRPFLMNLKELALSYSRLGQDTGVEECLSMLASYDPQDRTGTKAALGESSADRIFRM
jgi:hypothetical protein